MQMSSPHSCGTRHVMRRSQSTPLLPAKRSISTRNSPVRSPHGGARVGSGRPAKENIPPRVNETKEHILEKYGEPQKTQDELNSDIQSLINPKGRSWSLEECKLILVLILSLMYHKGTNPTDTISDIATLIHRGTKTRYYSFPHLARVQGGPCR